MSKFEIENRSGELIIRWKNRPKMRWFLLFFSLFWNGIVGLFVVTSLMSDPENLWFLSFHIMAGLVVAYITATMFLNRHEIRAGRTGLTTQTSPLPVIGGNRQFIPAEIDQLFVKKGATQKTNGRVTHQYYDLAIRTRKGKQKSLFGMLSQAEALELEQKVEDHLGIKDAAIPLDGMASDLLRKYMPGMADRAEEEHMRQQGKAGRQRSGLASAPRRLPGPEKDIEPELQHAEPGYIIDYNGNNLAMTAGEQFDWEEDLRSDRRLTVYDATLGENYYLYCEQVGEEEWNYFEERPLTKDEASALGLMKGEDIPQKLQNGDDRFFSRNAQSGLQFLMSNAQAREVSQQIFVSTSAQERFRLLSADDGKEVELFIQEQISKELIRDVLAG
ncbi:MAG: hypothetical protein AAF544_02560 [Bacteroidota bacterium]